MFSEFDDYLSLEFLTDYWYDEGTGIASSMLSRFSEQDWKDLSQQCGLRPHSWQIRCAETLDLVNHPTSTVILIELLSSANDDVVVAAVDSLRSKKDVDLNGEPVERLRKLSAQGSAPVKAVLTNFLTRLGAA